MEIPFEGGLLRPWEISDAEELALVLIIKTLRIIFAICSRIHIPRIMQYNGSQQFLTRRDQKGILL